MEDEGVNLLRQRLDALPQLIAQALAVEPPQTPELDGPGEVVVTGVGMAEGPARFAAAWLARQLGARARYAPIASFLAAAQPQAAPGADALWVFSQGLSPNARLALDALGRFDSGLLWTSPASRAASCAHALTGWRASGGRVHELPPACEDRLLLRVQGPLTAIAGVMQWARARQRQRGLHDPAPGLEHAPQRVTQALATGAALGESLGPATRQRPIRLIACTCGDYLAHAHLLAWKLLEGLCQELPPLLDPLQVAHGPLQASWHRGALWIVLAHDDEACACRALEARLRAALAHPGHTIVRIDARAPGPQAILEHAAALDAMMLAWLTHAPGDLLRWPGQGEDGALYEVTSPAGQAQAAE